MGRAMEAASKNMSGTRKEPSSEPLASIAVGKFMVW